MPDIDRQGTVHFEPQTQINMDEVLCIGGCADQGPPSGAPTKDVIFGHDAIGALTLSQPGPFIAGDHITIEQTYTVGEMPMVAGGGVMV